jgi:hypothetical protein
MSVERGGDFAKNKDLPVPEHIIHMSENSRFEMTPIHKLLYNQRPLFPVKRVSH